MAQLTSSIPAEWQARIQAGVLRGIMGLPRPLLRLFAGPPVVLDGQRLALRAQALLRLQRLNGNTGLSASTAEAARAAMREAERLTGADPLPGIGTRELRIPTPDGSVSARLYTPAELTGTSRLMVYYHGGGWVIGDLDSHDDVCRFLARRAGIRVLSVDYRLAPENPFPAAVDDAVAGYHYALEHAAELGTEPDSIAVGGDSAGGNLAAVVSHEATRSGGPKPVFQLLLYPAVDATARRSSREMFGNGFLLTDTDMDWFMDHYVPEVADRTNPRLSVLLADDLGGLPPAYVVTAGFDPLRDEGEEYARRLAEAGVPVVTRRFPGLIHGFANLRAIGGPFQEAMLEIAGSLRAGLALRANTATPAGATE